MNAELPFHLEREPEDLGREANVPGRERITDPLPCDHPAKAMAFR